MTDNPHGLGECGVGIACFLLLWWRNGRRGALKMRCLVTCGFDSHLKHLGWLF